MILDDLQDYSDTVEASFQAQLIRDYGKVSRVGPFLEETLALLMEHHEEWYEVALECYRQELVAKGEYTVGPYGELYCSDEYKEVTCVLR